MENEKDCMDCVHCYVDDLFYECMCNLNHSVCRGDDLALDGVCDDFEEV